MTKQNQTETLRATLTALLIGLRDRPRFRMLATLSVEQLLQSGGDQFGDLTLGELAASPGDHLGRCKGPILKRLQKFLESMHDTSLGEEHSTHVSPDDEMASRPPPGTIGEDESTVDLGPRPSDPTRASAPVDLPILGSVESERRLSLALVQIRDSGDYERIAGRTLGAYWQADWPRAPFEECLTLRQLTEMNVENFLKKRSLTRQKLSAVIVVLERVVRELRGGANAAPPESDDGGMLAAANRDERTVPIGERASAWIHPPKRMPRVWHGLLRDFLAQCQLRAAQSTLFVIGSRMPDALPADEFLTAWLGVDLSLPKVVLLSGENPSQIEELRARAHTAIAELLRRDAGAIVTAWESLLRGAGAHRDSLARAAGIVPDDFGSALLDLCISALGGEPVRVAEKVLEHHWTLDPRALALVIERLRGFHGGWNAEATAELGVFAPHVIGDDVRRLMAD